MHPSQPPKVSDPQPPYPGHPFGGVIREDRDGGLLAPAGTNATPCADDSDGSAHDDSFGFDFHLGVYARF